MKELDVLLTRYLDRAWESAPTLERETFLKLLEMDDPDLYALMVNRTQSADKDIAALVQRIQALPPY